MWAQIHVGAWAGHRRANLRSGIESCGGAMPTIWRAVKRLVLNGIDPEHPQNRERNGVIELSC